MAYVTREEAIDRAIKRVDRDDLTPLQMAVTARQLASEVERLRELRRAVETFVAAKHPQNYREYSALRAALDNAR